ncbi:hypothetical protein PMAYCL1PPCAC_06105, partial [Pristionchus mayeri]
MSRDYHLAGAILFPMALVGLACNLTVVAFLNSMPSLNNSFGSLTLSQAIVDSIHQLLFAFYFSPTIYFRNDAMYAVSDQFGYAILTAYQICCLSHVCISVNRFTAVYAPLSYSKIFNKWNTRKIIVGYWILGIAIMTYFLKFVDCALYLPKGTWIFSFKESPACYNVMWYGDFTLNSISVVIVATLDVAAILKLHCYNAKHTDAISAQRRSRQMNLVYQAALQGILFITELITYFLLSGYAKDKWQAFGLTSISWCLVNGMDGLIVLVFNRDFRRQIKKFL